ncbi:MAG: hypothetical protein JWN27_3037 [Candidatus Eremiobacteraeota bacterium]|nr:hypothetical protein [Candidatus Eremiobacteraeota bacterium]
MLRSLLHASAALAFAALIAPAVPSAAPPPGLAYDEIVRVVVNATPPPPGGFQADVAAVNAPAPAASAPPRKRGIGGLVNVAGAVLNGGGTGAVAGAVASEVVATAMENALEQSMGAQFGALGAAARGFLQPHLLRYAYWNGWERVDDVGAQTATIRKCDIGQVIRLDLARATYSVYTPDTEPTAAPAAPAPGRRGRAPAADPAQPGTMVADLTEATTSLGPLRIENQATTGYNATTTLSTTQSTGSCRDGSASIRTVEYFSGLTQPTVTSCPLRRPALPRTAGEVVTAPAGGCKPTFTFHRSGPTPPTTKLALYALVSFSGGASPAPQAAGSPAGGVAFLTERGNLKTLGPADSGVFEVPANFSRTP